MTWRCPKCNEETNLDVCPNCGTRKEKDNTGKISIANLFILVALSIALLLGVFFGIDTYKDYQNEKESLEMQEAEQTDENLKEEDLPSTETE